MTATAVPPTPAPPVVEGTGSAYAGLVTRVVAFALDAALINAVIWGTALIAALCLSLFDHIPHDVEVVLAAVGGFVAIAWGMAYFTFFWSTTGQTPGNRVLSIKVQSAHGERLRVGRAFLRVLVLPLSVIPLCAGLGLILVDRRRRALHDVLARTVVVYVTRPPRERPVLRPARQRRTVYTPPDAAQVASTSPPPSSATRAPNRISAG
jgi:uncharacterized RDD family membrane protein YckC